MSFFDDVAKEVKNADPELKAAVTSIGKDTISKIFGIKQAPKQTAAAPVQASVPNYLPYIAIGAGVLVLALILKR